MFKFLILLSLFLTIGCKEHIAQSKVLMPIEEPQHIDQDFLVKIRSVQTSILKISDSDITDKLTEKEKMRYFSGLREMKKTYNNMIYAVNTDNNKKAERLFVATSEIEKYFYKNYNI